MGAGHLAIEGLDIAVYVNSRYPDLDESMINPRASALFEMAGVGMFGGAARGDALVVLAAGAVTTSGPCLLNCSMHVDSAAAE